MVALAEDGRITRGLTKQIAERRQLVANGGKPLGWKVGFGAPAVMAKLNIAAPLTGFLMQENRVQAGATCNLAGWVKPVAEPEIAIYLSRTLPPGSDARAAREAIGALGPAIELADLAFVPEDVERILAGNIYQRHVILGPADTSRAGGKLDGLEGRLLINAAQTAATTDLEANTGAIVDIVRHVADALALVGEELQAGQIIIAGSVVPPVFLLPEHRELSFELTPVGGASVRFQHA
jgi:2-keto-4-pentenoate hydratase